MVTRTGAYIYIYILVYVVTMLVMLCFTINSPNSVLLGVLNAFLRRPPWYWMVCPPSRQSCLPLSPIVPPFSLFPFVGWCVRLAEGRLSSLSPIVPLFVSLYWMVCPPSRESCLPLSPVVPLFLFPCVAW